MSDKGVDWSASVAIELKERIEVLELAIKNSPPNSHLKEQIEALGKSMKLHVGRIDGHELRLGSIADKIKDVEAMTKHSHPHFEEEIGNGGERRHPTDSKLPEPEKDHLRSYEHGFKDGVKHSIEEFVKDLKYIVEDDMGYFFGFQEDKFDKMEDKWRGRVK